MLRLLSKTSYYYILQLHCTIFYIRLQVYGQAYYRNNFNVIKINNKKGYNYDNILLVENEVKKLVDLKEVDDMVLTSRLIRGLTKEQLEKINKVRKENSLPIISY